MMRYLVGSVPIWFGMVFFFFANCTNPAVCKCGDNEVCVENKCQPKGGEKTNSDGGPIDEKPKPIPCTTDFDCAADKKCENKECAALPAACTSDAECGTIRRCSTATKKCEDIVCGNDDACPTGTFCDPQDKKCKLAKACEKAEDCEKGFACNTCKKVCTKFVGTGRCSEDFNCDDIDTEFCDKCIGQCRKRGKPCEPCAKNAECGVAEDLCVPDAKDPSLKFCAVKCTAGRCPSGYACKEIEDPENPGTKSSQCFPASGNCAKPGQCETSADCTGSQICDPGTKLCVNGCKDDAECTSGKVCCRGRCVAPCTGNSECEQQEKCTKGCCKFEGECGSSKDCPDKQFCDKATGLCTPGCEFADDCGLPDPSRARCRYECKNKACVEDCTCRDAQLDCPPVTFCPKQEQPGVITPCRPPDGPICKRCEANNECGCKPGEDCLLACTKKECKADTDCAGMPNGATTCYNDRCSTKKACRNTSECPAGEKCENNFCGEACNNMCLSLQNSKRCFTACNPIGTGSECPSRAVCRELKPQSASGPACKPSGTQCKADADCTGDIPRCGEDGYCTDCAVGQVCRNFNEKDPLDLICIPLPPYVCLVNEKACEEAGF